MLIPPPSAPWCAKDSHLADWTVVVNNEKAFQVSSSALARNSRYFCEAFTAQASRAVSQRAQLSKVTRFDYPDLEALKDLLDFIARVASMGAGERLPEIDLADLLACDRLSSRLKAARHFSVPRLLDGIISSAQRNLTHRNCWQVLAVAADPDCGCDLLEEVALDYALSNFCEAAQQPQFVGCVGHEHLRRLLRSDCLNAPDEFQLFDIICGWVGADEAARLGHFVGLLSLMRLGRLTSGQLDRISANHLVRKTATASARIIDWATAASVSPSQLLTQQCSEPPLLREMLLPRLPHRAIFLCGGWEGSVQQEATIAPSFTVQVFDPISSIWIRHEAYLPSLDARHAYSACVEQDNTVYIIGGYVQPRTAVSDITDAQGPTARVQAYSLRQNVWRERAPMHEARNFVSACKCGGRVYAMGGHNGHHRLASAEAYHALENRWVTIAQMLNVRSDASAASLSGLVYICGGFSGSRFLSSTEQYNPEADQWTLVAQMGTSRSGLSVCSFGKYIYAMGGNSGTQRLATAERFDPDANSWTNVAPMLTQRSNFCSCVLHDCLYVIGGWSDQTRSTVRSVEQCGLNGAWESAVGLELPNSACSCCVISGCHLIEPLLSQERRLAAPRQ